MTPDILNQMATEFCRWPLPESVWPPFPDEYPRDKATGSNILNHDQALAMFTEIVGPKIAGTNNLERGIDEGLIRALGIVTSTPDQTAFGCAKAIRDEIERRRNNDY